MYYSSNHGCLFLISIHEPELSFKHVHQHISISVSNIYVCINRAYFDTFHKQPSHMMIIKDHDDKEPIYYLRVYIYIIGFKLGRKNNIFRNEPEK